MGLCFCARAFSSCGEWGPLFIAVRGPLTVWPLLLQSTGSRRTGSVVVVHGPSCSVACRILPNQGLNPRPPHWQADSQPLRHQGSPSRFLLVINFIHISVYMSIPIVQFIPPPPPAVFPPWCPYVCSLHLCLKFCPANRFICTILPGSTYMR